MNVPAHGMNHELVMIPEKAAAFLVNSRDTSKRAMTTRQWVACAGIVATLTPKNGTCDRRAHLLISFGLQAYSTSLWGARFWEDDAPKNTRPVDWLLDSEQPVSCVEDALQLLRNRPDLVMEFGCR